MFGAFGAVEHVSFTVGRGEMFGFVGPNGAGKTTTIKMLNCRLRPTGGTARVAGHDRRGRSHDPSRIPLLDEHDDPGWSPLPLLRQVED